MRVKYLVLFAVLSVNLVESKKKVMTFVLVNDKDICNKIISEVYYNHRDKRALASTFRIFAGKIAKSAFFTSFFFACKTKTNFLKNFF